MDTTIYTNRGEEVPLGVECALPYYARTPLHDERISAKETFFFSRAIETLGARAQLFPRLRLVSD
ncbi:MAG: hypothetical protein IH605_14805 [Burkholderiales bacterium]|nr:hypothetical protein [Burkholderiales bacterium]